MKYLWSYKVLCVFCQYICRQNKFLVSYDVCSLFTSIPLTETIDIAVDLLFEKNTGFKISKADLKKLFQFATSGTIIINIIIRIPTLTTVPPLHLRF